MRRTAALFESEEFRQEFAAIAEKLGTHRSTSSVLAVAGVSGGEGATTVALNLALAIARQSETGTLLVDANLRHASLHDALNAPCEPGLSDWSGDCDPPYQQTALASNLWVLTAGDLSERNAWERWGTALPALLTRACARFGTVIFDSPPVGCLPDSLILARAAGKVVLVAESDHTTLEALRYASEQVGTVGAEVCGLILSRRGRYLPQWLRR